MKVNLNIIEKLTGFKLPDVDELVARINAQLGGVEEVVNLGEKYKDARIVRVVECERHPDADRLSVVKIDDGGVVSDVSRDENGLVQVVCGAPNVHADMWAVWLPPKSTVPASFDDAEPFVLDARNLRGVFSQGMLAAGDELSLNDDHEGIVEIREYDLPQGAELKPGASFADTFGLNGYTFDIENKMFTHRPDCFGQLGVAREIAGIFGQKFESPDWYSLVQEFASGNKSLELTVRNDAKEKVPRFMAVVVSNVEVKPSPLWLQCELVAMGGKPINNIVDATNYVMFMTAQPTHAYDYDKLHGHEISARMAKAGEEVQLLNGKTYQLNQDDIVIADGKGVIGLGGIMGSGGSEVSSQTKNIVLECANFDMYTLRKTAMRHGIFTDALTRFNKGQSPLQNGAILNWLMGFVGGKQASEVFDVGDHLKDEDSREPVKITNEFIASRLGVNLSDEEVCGLLQNVEFDTKSESGKLSIHVPFWRTDIEMPEDVVEEIGRLYGFDKLPRELPRRLAAAAPKNKRREIKKAIRSSLAKSGANEVLTYSFVHENIFKKAGQNSEHAYKISNALSPDLQYYRLSVLPSLLDKVHANIKSGHDEFVLFEIGKAHDKRWALNSENLPDERTFVDGVYANKRPGEGAPFYKMRRLVEQLLRDIGVEYKITSISENDGGFDGAEPFDIKRGAWILSRNERLGIVGELKSSVRKSFKLPDYTSAFSLDVQLLEKLASDGKKYRPLSRFPSVSQDISLKVALDAPVLNLRKCIDKAIEEVANNIQVDVSLIDIYSANDTNEKTLTFHLNFTSYEHTLSDAEVKPIVDHIAAVALEKCDAVRA